MRRAHDDDRVPAHRDNFRLPLGEVSDALRMVERWTFVHAGRIDYEATMQDPQFVAEAQKLRLPISPKTGEEALKVVEEIYATPDDIVAAARKVTAE